MRRFGLALLAIAVMALLIFADAWDSGEKPPRSTIGTVVVLSCWMLVVATAEWLGGKRK